MISILALIGWSKLLDSPSEPGVVKAGREGQPNMALEPVGRNVVGRHVWVPLSIRVPVGVPVEAWSVKVR